MRVVPLNSSGFMCICKVRLFRVMIIREDAPSHNISKVYEGTRAREGVKAIRHPGGRCVRGVWKYLFRCFILLSCTYFTAWRLAVPRRAGRPPAETGLRRRREREQTAESAVKYAGGGGGAHRRRAELASTS